MEAIGEEGKLHLKRWVCEEGSAEMENSDWDIEPDRRKDRDSEI